MNIIKVKFFLGLFGVIFPLMSSLAAWDGPTTGPIGQSAKNIVYIASDFKNGGVSTVYRDFEGAIKKLGWNVRLENGEDDKVLQKKILANALNNHPDGIVISGFQVEEFPDLVAMAKAKNIVLVGWHASPHPGPTKDLFVNITTNATDVANLAAQFVIQDAKSKKRDVGVIIFNDSQYAIANLKTNTMKRAIEKCEGYKKCKVLSVENISISSADVSIPEIVPKLNSKYGKAWTYGLAINDAYYDTIHFPLREIGRTDIALISAGDGSEKAINRIETGLSQQVATIAEPLRMQGFQLADELNRAFAGKPWSGFISRPVLITAASLKKVSGESTPQDYEAAYSSIWSGKSK